MTVIFTVVNLSALDLNLLLVLDAVLAERSVARAAQRLHVTPPAISNALGRLRDALGDPIVTRSGRGIVPTPRALELGPTVSRALAEIRRALHGQVFDASTAQVVLTIGIADAGQLARLPALAALVRSRLPRARLRVVNVDTMLALGGIGGTEVDVAVGVSHAAPGIHRQQLYAEHYLVIARSDHPRLGARAGRRALSSEYHAEVHVAFGKSSPVVERAYRKLGIVRKVAVVVPTFTAAAAVVAATDLVAGVPESVVSTLSRALGLRVLVTPLRVPPIPMYLSWHQRTHADPAQALFRELIVQAMSAA
ncbi:MAG TPA: LysR family transcriptional regulator [Polyangiaceae bacterium]|nr:LysR family transcriptional regulator [Polyangiaceae bacterium]